MDKIRSKYYFNLQGSFVKPKWHVPLKSWWSLTRSHGVTTLCCPERKYPWCCQR